MSGAEPQKSEPEASSELPLLFRLRRIISERDEEIQRLRVTVEEKQRLIEHVKGCMERFKKERDELRKQNSELSGKLALATRHNSSSPPTNRSFPFSSRRQYSGGSLKISVPSSTSKTPLIPDITNPSCTLQRYTPITKPPSSSSPSAPPGTAAASSPPPSTPHTTPLPAGTITSTPTPITPAQAQLPPSQQPTAKSDSESDTEYSEIETPKSESVFSPNKDSIFSPGLPPMSSSSTAVSSPGSPVAIGVTPPGNDKSKPLLLSSSSSSPTKKGDGEGSVATASSSSAGRDSGSLTDSMTKTPLLAIGEESSLDVPDMESSFDSTTSLIHMHDPAKRMPHRTRSASAAAVRRAAWGTAKSQSSELASIGEGEGEKEGEFSEEDKARSIRSRTKTISSARPGKREFVGRKSRMELMKVAIDMQSFGNYRPGKRILNERELLSPEVELKVQEKVCNSLGKKYGGLKRAVKAAITIQRAYRDYKLRKRFEEIRFKAGVVRKRAQTMKGPQRKPSLLRKQRPEKYSRQVTSPTDPMQQAREISNKLSSNRFSPSTTRLYLLRAKSQVDSLSDKDKDDSTAAKPTLQFRKPEECKIEDEEAVKKAIEKVERADAEAEEEEKQQRQKDRVDGFSESFSADDVYSAGSRPLSVFSLQEGNTLSLRRGVRTKGDRSAKALKKKINIGMNHFNRKPIKGIQYLVMEELLKDDPHSVAMFFKRQFGLSKEKIGEFLGEINKVFNMAVLDCVVELLDLKNKPIDVALRQFQELFRIPGEAQKIDKIMQAFALEYYKQNRDEGNIKSEDAAYMLSFAIMMLHTSLHNPSVKKRTSKKQWISMNRDCNDGDNFPTEFLLEIYDRIQKSEFNTGKDHTDEVGSIEKQFTGLPMKLTSSQRRFIHKVNVMEVDNINSRIAIKGRHQRTIFVFSDLLIIGKRHGKDLYKFRKNFYLNSAAAISFDSGHYKYGVQLYSSLDRKPIFQCSCESEKDRAVLLNKLDSTISEVKEMDKERMAELGSSLSRSSLETSGIHRMSQDVKSSIKLSSSLQDIRRASLQLDGENFVPGVGSIAHSGVVPSELTRRHKSVGSTDKRVSGDSGIDSQHQTPISSPSLLIPTISTPPRSKSVEPLDSPRSPPPRSSSSDQLLSSTPNGKSRGAGKVPLRETRSHTPELPGHGASNSSSSAGKLESPEQGKKYRFSFSRSKQSKQKAKARANSSPRTPKGKESKTVVERERSSSDKTFDGEQSPRKQRAQRSPHKANATVRH